MKYFFSFLIISLIAASACKRIVEYDTPFPTEVNFCESDPSFLGTWISDSVWVTTSIDSIDSTFTNRNPGNTYIMTVACGDEKRWKIEYVTFAGVRTLDLNSTNYIADTTSFRAFNQLDSARIDAEFVLDLDDLSDSTFTGSYTKDLGNGQVSFYQIFYRKN